MNRKTALCLAAICWLATSSALHADSISTSEFSWGYHFEPDGSRKNTIANHGATGFVDLPGSGGTATLQTATGVPTQISTPIFASSNAKATDPQTVNSLPFSVNVRLTDWPSGIREFVSFGGVLNGNLWNNGSTLTPTFFSPLSQTVNIDHHLYTVRFAGYTPPSLNGQPGKFVFDVTVRHNPEPASLVLAGIGAPLFGLILRRRRQARLRAG
jgi:hypothetical protein